MKFSVTPQWELRGWDTFAGESYRIGRYYSEAGARRAAKAYLRRLQRQQPQEIAGPLQDRVSIVRPDGSEMEII